jgi:hypothetical protein
MEQPPPVEQPPVQQPMAEPMPPPMQPAPVQPVPGTAPMRPGDVPPYYEPAHYLPRSIYGVALTAGGGVSDFEYAGASSVTSTGGSWDVRMAFGTRTFLGLEGAYVGAAQSISGLGLGSNTLLRNGFEGVLRGQFPLAMGPSLFEPYAFVGLGWNHYSLSNTPVASASIVGTSDDTFTVPWGFGFSAGYMGFLADVRFTYRPTYDANILGDASLTNWNFGGAIGYEF